MNQRCLQLTLGLCLVASATAARASDEPGIELSLAPVQLRVRDTPRRSPVTAVLLALGSTFGPIGAGIGMMVAGDGGADLAGALLIGAGAAIGPSVGHFYAGEWGRGFATAGGRVLSAGAGMGLVTLGFAFAFAGAPAAGVACLAGAGVFGLVTLGLAIYDFIDAAGAARRYNRVQRLRRRIAIAPMFSRTPSGGQRFGVALTGRF